MSSPLKSNRLIVAESLVDRHLDSLPESAGEVMGYAGILGVPITAEEAVEVLECFRQIRVLAGKGVLVDEGRWCGMLCEQLDPTRAQRIVNRLETLLGQGATHVMHHDSGTPMAIARAIEAYHSLDDNEVGLQPAGCSGLFECDSAGRKVLRGNTLTGLLGDAGSCAIIRDDGRRWHGSCSNIDEIPDEVGIGKDEPFFAVSLPVDSLDSAVVEDAADLVRNSGGSVELRGAYRVNDGAYLITFCGGC